MPPATPLVGGDGLPAPQVHSAGETASHLRQPPLLGGIGRQTQHHHSPPPNPSTKPAQWGEGPIPTPIPPQRRWGVAEGWRRPSG